jgi:hypothetical protein
MAIAERSFRSVRSVKACRELRAKSRRNDDNPPRRWNHFKPSPWGQFRLSQRLQAAERVAPENNTSPERDGHRKTCPMAIPGKVGRR